MFNEKDWIIYDEHLFSIFPCLFYMVFLCLWVFQHYEICKYVNILFLIFVFIYYGLDFRSYFIDIYATKTSTRFSIFTTCANNTCSFIYRHTNSCSCWNVCREKFQSYRYLLSPTSKSIEKNQIFEMNSICVGLSNMFRT